MSLVGSDLAPVGTQYRFDPMAPNSGASDYNSERFLVPGDGRGLRDEYMHQYNTGGRDVWFARAGSRWDRVEAPSWAVSAAPSHGLSSSALSSSGVGGVPSAGGSSGSSYYFGRRRRRYRRFSKMSYGLRRKRRFPRFTAGSRQAGLNRSVKRRRAGPGRMVASVPAAVGGDRSRLQPKVLSVKNGTRIIHTEYLSDINVTNNAFTLLAINNASTSSSGFAINPGLPSAFPWLSSAGLMYESYRVNSLRYEYRARCASSIAGTVIMAIDYDNHDSPPASKQAILTYANACSSSAWSDCNYVCNTSDLHKRKTLYTRTGPVPAGADSNLYDVGTLYVGATGGTASLVDWGELYVHYDITFQTPQALNPFSSLGSGAFLSITGGTTLAPFAYSGTAGGMLNFPGQQVPVVWGKYTAGVFALDANTFTFTQYFEGFMVWVGKANAGLASNTLVTANSTDSTFVACSYGAGYSADVSNEVFSYRWLVKAVPGSTFTLTSMNGAASQTLHYSPNTTTGGYPADQALCVMYFLPASFSAFNAVDTAVTFIP